MCVFRAVLQLLRRGHEVPGKRTMQIGERPSGTTRNRLTAKHKLLMRAGYCRVNFNRVLYQDQRAGAGHSALYIHDRLSSRCLIPRRSIMLVGGEREADLPTAILSRPILRSTFYPSSFHLLQGRFLHARDRQTSTPHPPPQKRQIFL